MSTPKHTPGPWQVSGVGPKGSVRKIFRSTDTTSYPVATVALDHLDRLGTGDTDATAHLIAAAPEMLEALEKFVSAPNYEIENVKAFARDIIAKARGGG